jgi:filamentous hemagglutinin family protein
MLLHRLLLAGVSVFVLQTVWILAIRSCKAQISPDSSLPSNSTVTLTGNTFQIDGGAIAGTNLYHSFRDFSLPTGFAALFNNGASIQNIFSRVTGNTPSQIDGLIQTNGIANLFMLNPNGIIFGPNARLNIGGSFFASTADTIRFADGNQFTTRNPQPTNLLTVTVPIGLQFGPTPTSILNQSRATDPTGRVVGLQVPTGNTLALIGGTLSLPGGALTATQGQIDLGSVGSSAQVGLTAIGTRFIPNYETVSTFQDIQFSNTATANVSGTGGGSIHLHGKTITLTGRSSLIADTLGNLNGQGIQINAQTLQIDDGAYIAAATFGAGNTGDITVQASDAVNLTGFGFEDLQNTYVLSVFLGRDSPLVRQNGILSGTVGRGNSGNITIATRRLNLQAGGVIRSLTYAEGHSGHLLINAAESVQVNGSAISLSTLATGNAGNMTISTERLILSGGGQISAATLFGNGKGGEIRIHATEAIEGLDTPANAALGTTITTSSFLGTGTAGNLTIETGLLRLLNGSQITSGSGGIGVLDRRLLPGGPGGNLSVQAKAIELVGISPEGRYVSRIGSDTTSRQPGGSVTIHTQHLLIRDGGRISALALGNGKAGNVTIQASGSVELNGIAPDGQAPSGIFASAGNQLYQNTGASGDLFLSSPNLLIRDGATVTVNNQGKASAGNLTIQANKITLDHRGSITAATASGEGGNISLNIRDYLLLRRNSLISAEAGGTGIGGNIRINAGFVVARLTENSDIQANAFRGNGGNIAIAAQGIFGLRFQTQTTPFSDITASSQFGLSGVVTLNTPNLDPNRGIVEFPNRLVDPATLIANSCIVPRTARQGSFIVTGAGGLPTSPDDLASSGFVTYELLPLTPKTSSNRPSSTAASPQQNLSNASILEMDGIYQLSNGTWILGRSCW